MTPEYQQIIKALQQLKTQNVKKAEQYFNVHSQSPEFINSLESIMKDNNLSQQVKMFASIHLNNKFCESLTENPQQQQLSKLIFNILIDPHIKNSHKRNFEKGIVLLMGISTQQNLNDWMQLVKILFQLNFLDSAYLLIACFAVAELEHHNLITVVAKTFEPSLTINLNFQNICNLNQLLKTWIVVFDKLIQCQQENRQILHDIINSKKLLQIIQWVFDYEAAPQFYICIKQGLHELNLLKYEAAQLYERILTYGVKFNTCTRGLQLLINITQKVVTTLAIMGGYKSMIQTCQCNDFLTSLTKILIIYCKKQLKSKDLWVNILNLVIFPFLEASHEQRQIFKDNYEHFNSLLEDCCDSQQLGLLKTENAQLLQVIGNRVPLAIQYALERCIESLKIKFNLKEMPKNSPEKILQIQTAFQLYKHKQITNQLKFILAQQIDNIKGHFQLARVFQFLAYNYSEIYKISNQGNFLIFKALKYQGSDTVLICCMDFLSNIADEYFNDEYFKIICDKCVTFTHGNIWTIASKTIQNHHMQITQDAMCYLITQIFKRLQIQIASIQSNKKSQTLNSINCIHLLKKILKYSQQYNNAKQIIWGIVRYYDISVKYSIDDQVILVIEQLLNHKKYVTVEFEQLLPMILTGFEKDKYQSNQYYYLLNNYIMKGKTKEVYIIIQALLKAFNYQIDKLTKNVKQKQIIGLILLLIQNFLAYHGTQCEKHIFQMIINNISQIINQSNKIITSRAINILFLCHMHEKYYEVIDLLDKYRQTYSSYDAKVIIQCLNNQIFRQKDSIIVPKLLNLMIMIAKKSAINKQKDNKTKTKTNTKSLKKIKSGERIQNYQIVLRRIQVPFNKQVSEYEQIKKCLHTMKQNNEQLYSAIINQLSAQSKKQLITIINSIESQGQNRIIFKVSGIKQKQTKELQQQFQEKKDQFVFKRRHVTNKRLKKFYS